MANTAHSESASLDHWQVNPASEYLLYQWECLTTELLKSGIEPISLLNSIYMCEYGIINLLRIVKDFNDYDSKTNGAA